MKEDTLFLMIVATFAMGVSCLFGYLIGCSQVHQKAVDNNVAVWTVDKRGNVSFEWINK